MTRLHKTMGRDCNSGGLVRVEEATGVALTNKESVYGLIIDELYGYYKAMGHFLELDMGFPKSMRKSVGRSGQLEREENLSKAAEILAESKNRAIKELMQHYEQEWRQYAESKGIMPENTNRNRKRFSLGSMRHKASPDKISDTEPLLMAK